MHISLYSVLKSYVTNALFLWPIVYIEMNEMIWPQIFRNQGVNSFASMFKIVLLLKRATIVHLFLSVLSFGKKKSSRFKMGKLNFADQNDWQPLFKKIFEHRGIDLRLKQTRYKDYCKCHIIFYTQPKCHLHFKI